jgi:hypothetical protein
MPNNNPTGKHPHTGSDRNQGMKNEGMKNAGSNERSGSNQRSAGARADDQQGGKSRSDLDNQKRSDR